MGRENGVPGSESRKSEGNGTVWEEEHRGEVWVGELWEELCGWGEVGGEG